MKHSLRLAAFISTLTLPSIALAQVGAPIHLEAEDAQISGKPTVQTERAGFLGKGYVSGFSADGDKLSWTIPNARAGIYEVRVRYNAPDRKGYDVVINGSKISAMFAPSSAGFDTATAGRVELPGGKTTLSIEKGWGHYDIDAVDLVPITVAQTLTKPPATLSDARATPATRALMNLLINQYGAGTFSGQVNEDETAYIQQTTGQIPAIFGGDFMDYSPSRVANGATPEGTSEKFLQRAKDGQILALMWHWNAPSKLINADYVDKNGNKIQALWWRGFYTDATTFDLQAALADPNSQDYKLLLSDIDAIAVQLKKFDDAGVPVLWRPLHEAEGGWFWWGAKGPEPFKKLWRIMYDRLTNQHDLHNLIWVYTAGSNPAWYPGDDVVDIVGADSYPSDYTDPLTATWDDLNTRYGGRKLIALSEVGKVPDIAKMRKLGVKWSYFTSWGGDLGPKAIPAATLQTDYTAPGVLNLREVSALETAATPVVAAPAPMLADAVKPYFPPTAIEYNAIAKQTQDNLQTQILQKWFPASVNLQQGGFDQNFAYDWTKLPGTERSIVYQSRLTWTAAQATMRLPAEEFIYRNYTSHGIAELSREMWDAQNGGFYWQVDKGVADRNGEKHVYGNAFAIYALSAAYKATKNPDALRLAQQDFFWLEKHAHDPKNKGYFEALARDGKPILSPVSPDQMADFIGTRYGYKSMNTHIHLLEAYGALYEVWPEPQLKTRLNELFELVRDKIYVEPGALNQYYTLDWRPIPAEDSYGHDIETAYLLTEAAHILGRDNDPKTKRAARMLVDHTLDVAFDKTIGGVADGGGVFGGLAKPDKVWWTQAEALNAMLLMHELYGTGRDADPRYWLAFVKQWNFIRQYQIDPVNGGWFSHVSAAGSPPPMTQVKSDRWTESYHQGRAMMNVPETLKRLAAGDKRP